jgi:hypothetical protein
MECRRYVPGPEIYCPDNECGCEHCVEDDQRVALIDVLEVALRRPLVQLLDAGMMPDDIVSAVRERAPKKSRAWMLTRVELTYQAGYWLSRADWSGQLEQVDRLSKHTGFSVGLTIPGWLHDWSRRKGRVEDRVLRDSVADVWQALEVELAQTSSFARPGDGAWDLVAGRPSVPANVVWLQIVSEDGVQSIGPE